MFSTQLTLTIDAVDKVLDRVNQDNNGSKYTFTSDLEAIVMLIRHDVTKTAQGPVNRHNVSIERTIFATPVANRKFSSIAFTMRDSEGVGPTALLHLVQGANTLFATLDQDVVRGVN